MKNAAITAIILADNARAAGRKSKKLSGMLKGHPWWEGLSHTEHQRIGKYIANNQAAIAKAVGSTAHTAYLYTDGHGNGIYS